MRASRFGVPWVAFSPNSAWLAAKSPGVSSSESAPNAALMVLREEDAERHLEDEGVWSGPPANQSAVLTVARSSVMSTILHRMPVGHG